MDLSQNEVKWTVSKNIVIFFQRNVYGNVVCHE